MLESYGWGRITIDNGSGAYSGAFSYLNDFPGDLVRALVPMATGLSKVAAVTMLREPEGAVLSFLNRRDMVEVRIDQTTDPFVTVLHATPGALTRAVVDAFDQLDRDQYAQLWPQHPFPDDTLAALREAGSR